MTLLVSGWANGFLGFFRPHRIGAFGGLVNAGPIDELKVGEVKPVIDGKFYLSRVPEGFIALWWKCPHLGCVVPWKENDPVEPGDQSFAERGRFFCGCHGSEYDRYGQIVKGPAPRPMDRFPLTIVNGRVIVDTNPATAIVRRQAGPDAAVTPA